MTIYSNNSSNNPRSITRGGNSKRGEEGIEGGGESGSTFRRGGGEENEATTVASRGGIGDSGLQRQLLLEPGGGNRSRADSTNWRNRDKNNPSNSAHPHATTSSSGKGFDPLEDSRSGRSGNGIRSQLHQQQHQYQHQSNSSSNFSSHHSRLPLEQGVVRALKDSFGFIRPVNRPDDVFFHYSELQANNSSGKDRQIDDWHVGDPVEFRVMSTPATASSTNGEKIFAVDIRAYSGEIQWEVPLGRLQGCVDRVNSRKGDGWIRVFSTGIGDGSAIAATPSVGDNITPTTSTTVTVSSTTVTFAIEDDLVAPKHGDKDTVEKSEELICRFSIRDTTVMSTTPSSTTSQSPHNNARTNSSSKFRVFGKRNGSDPSPPLLLAPGDVVEFDLVLYQPTKEHHARNVTILMSEQQRVQQEREQKLLETAVEEKGVVTTLKGEYGFIRSNKRREAVYFHYSSVELDENDADDTILKEGQDLKFLVVNHQQLPTDQSSSGSDGNGVSGSNARVSARRVSIQPKGSVKFHDVLACGVTGIVTQCPQPVDSGHSLEARGKVHLMKPISLNVKADENASAIMKTRVISEVYFTAADSPGGTFAPRGGTSVSTLVQSGDTLLFDVVKDYVDGACHAVPTIHLVPNPTPNEIVTENHDDVRKVRLIEINLAGRAQGVVSAVKEAFGFLQYAERAVDVHFKLYQILPDELQDDIRRNRGLANVDGRGQALRLVSNAEVEFDISVHGTIQVTAIYASKSSKCKNNYERERENLKAQRILFLPPKTIQLNHVLARKIRGSVIKEDEKQLCSGRLEWDKPIPQLSLDLRHPLVSKMIDEYLASDLMMPLLYHDIQSPKEESSVLDIIEFKQVSHLLRCSHIPQTNVEGYPGRLCIQKVQNCLDRESLTQNDKSESSLNKPVGSVANECSDVSDSKNVVDHDEVSRHQDEISQDEQKHLHFKKRNLGGKPIRRSRYDKSSLSAELRDSTPPAIKDIVEFDLIQSRRTMHLYTENLVIVERMNPVSLTAVKASENEGIGVVSEVVAARRFGFISVLDEFASKREMLFFHLSDISCAENAVETSEMKMKVANTVRKGDEVKFDVRVSNGKRAAYNVKFLPRGSIPSKANKNACRGIVLMEPLRSSRKPTREGFVSAGNIASKSTKEEGCILLLDDPSGMFECTPKAELIDKDAASRTQLIDSTAGDTHSATKVLEAIEGNESNTGFALKRIFYTNGSLAILGQGSTLGMNDSLHPRRGDLVTFVRSGRNEFAAREVRIEKRAAASCIRGCIESIYDEKASFVASTEGDDVDVHEIDLVEATIHSELYALKENDLVEGVLHDGRIYGVVRISDLQPEVKSRTRDGHEERPKMNILVKKDRGGTIMAQSMMAKGPDNTHGFASGWTKRTIKCAKL